MKIGIITFHRADNFGAALQCYALQTFLEQQGHDVHIIDYRCRAIEQVYYVLNPRLLFLRRNVIKAFKEYLFNLRNHADMIQKQISYKDFRSKYMHLIPFRTNENNDIDAYIAGSDQIWNLSLTHGYKEPFYLDFPVKKNSLRISYAASSETAYFPLFAKYTNQITPALSAFDSISVREPSLKGELKKYTSKNIDVCVDPTFLIEQNIYEKILIKPQESNYVLVYHMAEIAEAVDLANLIAKDRGLQVIEIHANFKSPCGARHKKGLGPLQILGYIKYADTVITNSFHGTALSLILQKNLWVINKYRSARLSNILTLAGMRNRYITSLEEYNDATIDYDIVNENMHGVIDSSKSFLIKSLTGNRQ